MTTPTEREAFEAWASHPDRHGKLPIEAHANGAHKDSRTYSAYYGWTARADMLAADAQEIALLKEKVAYEQALSDKHFAECRQLQAELDGIRKQEPVRWEFRWTNPGDQPCQPDSMLEWVPVSQKGLQSMQDAVIDLLAYTYGGKSCHEVRALYLAAAPQPPQAERVPMTEGEIAATWDKISLSKGYPVSLAGKEFARAIEAFHGIGDKP